MGDSLLLETDRLHRRQIQALEEELKRQVSHLQAQVDILHVHVDKGAASKSKTLSDEVQTQRRQLDSLDTRLWEYASASEARQQVIDEVTARIAELEQVGVETS